jgi:hypothetical protein
MTDRSDMADPRISNFSHARILDPNQKVQDLTKAETMFLAPEVCQNKPYDCKADCWAFGVILYFLLGSTFHIKDQDERLMKRAITTDPFNSE